VYVSWSSCVGRTIRTNTFFCFFAPKGMPYYFGPQDLHWDSCLAVVSLLLGTNLSVNLVVHSNRACALKRQILLYPILEGSIWIENYLLTEV
jgi:hypothetical protein